MLNDSTLAATLLSRTSCRSTRPPCCASTRARRVPTRVQAARSRGDGPAASRRSGRLARGALSRRFTPLRAPGSTAVHSLSLARSRSRHTRGSDALAPWNGDARVSRASDAAAADAAPPAAAASRAPNSAASRARASPSALASRNARSATSCEAGVFRAAARSHVICFTVLGFIPEFR